MIAQIKTPRQKQRFLNACRGKLCLGATMPLAFALVGKSQPGRFFAGPTLALDVGGSTAWLAGHANPEELAGFLAHRLEAGQATQRLRPCAGAAAAAA